MPPDSTTPRLPTHRHDILARIVVEGRRRRRRIAYGSAVATVLISGLMTATLGSIGGEQDDRELLSTDLLTSTSSSIPAPRATIAPPTIAPPAITTPVPTTEAPTASVTTLRVRDQPGAWTALAPAGVPPRFGGARAWTGTELLVWSGRKLATDGVAVSCPEGCPLDPVLDGVVFDPARNKWRTMSPGPLSELPVDWLTTFAGTWTGSEFVVWQGSDKGSMAAYDPVVDRWRALPTDPLGGLYRAVLASRGNHVYLFGQPRGSSDTLVGATLNLANGEWKPLADPPGDAPYPLATATVGDEVVTVWRSSDNGGTTVAALQPDHTWRKIADLGPDSGNTVAIGEDHVWFLPCGTGLPTTITEVTLTSGSARTMPAAAPGCPKPVLVGSTLMTVTTIYSEELVRTGVTVHMASPDGWREVRPPPGMPVGEATWTGSEILFWGACDCQGGFGGLAVEAGYRLRL